MPGFAMTPASGFNPQTPDEFPDYIQFQADGVDLGGPDADTLDFGEGLEATRGTGENANVVTVVATGTAGGGAETLVLRLFPLSQGDFNGTSFSDWDATSQVASADAAWVTDHIALTRTGMYQVTIVGRVATEGGPWGIPGETYYGTEVANAQVFTKSGHSRKAENESGYVGPPEVTWTDAYFVNITDIDAQTITPKVFAHRYQDNFDPAVMNAMVSVTRVGPPLIES